MSFKDYFKTNLTEAIQNKSEENKEDKSSKILKIKDDFETELRKLYKIKSVINTAFGIQIDFYKKPEKDEILALVDSRVKFKGTSIFIEF